MIRTNLQIFLGILAACLPFPMLLELFGYFRIPSASSMLNWYTILLGIPAAMLILGYQIARSNNDFSYTAFIRGGAIVGITLGLFCMVPLSLPLIYFRASDETALEQFVELLTIFSMLAAMSTVYGYVFWLVGIKPKNQNIFQRSS